MAVVAVVLILAGVVLMLSKARIEGPASSLIRALPWMLWVSAAFMFFGSLAKIVPPGHAGVQVLFGRVLDEPLPSGLHFINPFMRVELLEVRTRNYTMSSVSD